jgi:hypothetical protein
VQPLLDETLAARDLNRERQHGQACSGHSSTGAGRPCSRSPTASCSPHSSTETRLLPPIRPSRAPPAASATRSHRSATHADDDRSAERSYWHKLAVRRNLGVHSRTPPQPSCPGVAPSHRGSKPPAAHSQSTRPRVRLRPRLLVQTNDSGPGSQVVVPSSVFRATAQEPRISRLETRASRGSSAPAVKPLPLPQM